MLLQKVPFILLCHRRKLMQIADHKQLHPAKGLIITAMATQNSIHRVE